MTILSDSNTYSLSKKFHKIINLDDFLVAAAPLNMSTNTDKKTSSRPGLAIKIPSSIPEHHHMTTNGYFSSSSSSSISTNYKKSNKFKKFPKTCENVILHTDTELELTSESDCEFETYHDSQYLLRKHLEKMFKNDATKIVIKNHFLLEIPNSLLIFSSKLLYLDLSFNELSDLPESISVLSNLQELSLKENHFHEIPVSIKYLTQLRKLNLSKNKIEYICYEITFLTNLQCLNLKNNNISTIPPHLGIMYKNLQRLCLENNPLDNQSFSLIFPILNKKKHNETRIFTPIPSQVQLSVPTPNKTHPDFNSKRGSSLFPQNYKRNSSGLTKVTTPLATSFPQTPLPKINNNLTREKSPQKNPIETQIGSEKDSSSCYVDLYFEDSDNQSFLSDLNNTPITSKSNLENTSNLEFKSKNLEYFKNPIVNINSQFDYLPKKAESSVNSSSRYSTFSNITIESISIQTPKISAPRPPNKFEISTVNPIPAIGVYSKANKILGIDENSFKKPMPKTNSNKNLNLLSINNSCTNKSHQNTLLLTSNTFKSNLSLKNDINKLQSNENLYNKSMAYRINEKSGNYLDSKLYPKSSSEKISNFKSLEFKDRILSLKNNKNISNVNLLENNPFLVQNDINSLVDSKTIKQNITVNFRGSSKPTRISKSGLYIKNAQGFYEHHDSANTCVSGNKSTNEQILLNNVTDNHIVDNTDSKKHKLSRFSIEYAVKNEITSEGVLDTQGSFCDFYSSTSESTNSYSSDEYSIKDSERKNNNLEIKNEINCIIGSLDIPESEEEVLVSRKKTVSEKVNITKMKSVLEHLRDIWDLKSTSSQENLIKAQMKNRVWKSPKRQSFLSEHQTKPKISKEMHYKVAKELLETEKVYIDSLEAIMTNYYKPISQKKLLGSQEIRAIFSNIEVIYNLHSIHLLPELIKENKENNLSFIGHVISKYAPMFRLYIDYINNYEKSQELCEKIKHLWGKNSILPAGNNSTTFLQMPTSPVDIFSQRTFTRKQSLTISKNDISPTSPTSAFSLQSLLITPVQRIPRYKLLLERLISHTSCEEKDYNKLVEAFEQISLVAHEINESKRRFEQRSIINKLMESSSHFRGQKKLNPNSSLIKYGPLLLNHVVNIRKQMGPENGVPEEDQLQTISVKKKFDYYLLDGILMQCTFNDNTYKVNKIHQLSTKLKPASKLNDHTLRVVDNDCILYFTVYEQNLDEWEQAINGRLDSLCF
ncbi:hypothetical protein BB558_005934 [Smittium angustum]|uniref:DH domain-containing protein n=1 Tax=Smittium angustum TaxID=133377 RepID=A0A2U1IZ33_SMIAN|nr:hypothetical protein BB558_005934 [Smittium angustum]